MRRRQEAGARKEAQKGMILVKWKVEIGMEMEREK